MKKILFFTDTPLVGGAEMQMFLLAKALDKKTYSVSLACLASPILNGYCHKWIDEGLNVYRIPVRHKHDPRQYFYVQKLLRREKPDLFHVHLWNPAACRYALLASKMTKTPLVITEHDPFPLSGIKDFVRRHLISHVRAIIAISDDNTRFIQNRDQILKRRVHRIHNGIDLNWWKSQLLGFSEAERSLFRREHFKATDDNFVILNVATLHERKGQDLLLAAFEKVYKKHPEAKLALVGEGPLREKLEQKIQKNPAAGAIVLLGQRKDMAKLMRSADLFVLSSRREAFGLVLLEAAVAGLPVIATRTGGVPEIIEHEISGLLVSPGNFHELANSINHMMENGLERRELAKHALENCTRMFTAKRMALETEKLYNKLLEIDANQ